MLADTPVPEPELAEQSLPAVPAPVWVHLIGPDPELRDLLDEHLEDEDLPIVIHHASERIGRGRKGRARHDRQARQLVARRP